MSNEVATVLKLSLHKQLVGYLASYSNVRNVFTFNEDFKNNQHRPTLSLITHPAFPKAEKVMSEQWVKRHRLHPVFSNLLPEGVMRDLLTQELKIHRDDEFKMLAYLGDDLPGALVAEPIDKNDIPEYAIKYQERDDLVTLKNIKPLNKFSLAGVQVKFSMQHKDGRYNLSKTGELGDWIIKTPSTQHAFVPLNEYSTMRLAAMVGIDIPEIKLVKLNALDDLPKINLPNEQYAYAIKRFDRDNDLRIHMEDFAQVLVKYPNDKYQTASYEQIGKLLYAYSGDGIADAQQFARRLLVNILLANGDAHLKNWSLLYQDNVTPRLSPAYDIVYTQAYIDGEQAFAMNLAKNKNWYKANFNHFEKWAEKSNIPWRIIKPHLDDTLEKARVFWPSALRELPMLEEHQAKLIKHMQSLTTDLRIKIR